MRLSSLGLLFLFFISATSRGEATPLEVRTAAQNSQPKFFQQGVVFTGVCVDVFEKIQRVDRELKFSELKMFVPLPRIEYMLRMGDMDAFCGLAKTVEREAEMDFIEPPLYTTYAALAVRSNDDVDVRSYDDLRKLGDKGVVLAIAKSIHAKVLAEQPGVVVDDGAKDISANVTKLLLGRGRFAFHSANVLADHIKRENLEDKIKVLPMQFEPQRRYMVVSKLAPPKMKEKLSAAIEKLHKNGELARIFHMYEPK